MTLEELLRKAGLLPPVASKKKKGSKK